MKNKKEKIYQGKKEGGLQMPYIKPEIVEEVRKIDLLTYLVNYQPERLRKISHDTYCLKDHDSLHISNGLWHWQSCGIGDRSALDFLIKVDGYKFIEAAKILLKNNDIKSPEYVKYSKKESNKQLHIPTRCNQNQRAIDYLLNRGIDYHIILDCIDKSLLYQSIYQNPNTKKAYINVTFMGYDRYNHLPKYANLRGIDGSFKGDAPGSDKHYSFLLEANDSSDEVHVCEAAVDVLSYATLLKMQGMNYKDCHILSLGGVQIPRKDSQLSSKTPIALVQFLKDFPEVKKIVLHLDNDRAGRLATKTIKENLWYMTVIDQPPMYGKDVNNELTTRLDIDVHKRHRSYNLQR
ncbi:MAG: toprim domain-containing protein [Faecalibacillus sp.]